MGRGLAGSVVVTGALLLAGCRSGGYGSVAVWELTDPAAVSAESTELEVEVMRVACASGRTGEVRSPRITYEEDRVIVRIDVEPLSGGAHTCEGNEAVPVTVTLRESLGDRRLVDGACEDEEAARTVFCDDEGVRWG